MSHGRTPGFWTRTPPNIRLPAINWRPRASVPIARGSGCDVNPRAGAANCACHAASRVRARVTRPGDPVWVLCAFGSGISARCSRYFRERYSRVSGMSPFLQCCHIKAVKPTLGAPEVRAQAQAAFGAFPVGCATKINRVNIDDGDVLVSL
jgi:hypothetical protein